MLYKGAIPVANACVTIGTVFGWATVPASQTAPGTLGELAQDSNYFYICTSANNWVRVKDVGWVSYTVEGTTLMCPTSDTVNGSTVTVNGTVSGSTLTL